MGGDGLDLPRFGGHRLSETVGGDDAARARRQCTEESEAEAVTRVRQSGQTIAQVARDLDLTDSARRNWVERAQHAGSPSSELSSAEHKELQQLRKENRVLRMERELLTKAAAFVCHERDR